MEPEAYREMADVQDRHWWFRARRNILEGLLGSMDLPEHPEILEVGAGPGGNLEMLAEFGNLKAMEMDGEARRMAEDRFKDRVEIRYGKLPDEVPFPPASFDLICLFDVLEHVEDDGAALAALRGLARPGAKALVTVPAHAWLWSQHDERLHHRRRYARREFRDKLTGAGWQVARLSYFNTLLFPLAVAGRLVDRLRPAQAPAGAQVPAQPVNELLFRIFALEAALLKGVDLPIGVSLFAILTAP